MEKRLKNYLIYLLLILIMIFSFNFSIKAQQWPAENDWIPFIGSNWVNINDPTKDVSIDYLDYVSIDSYGLTSSIYWYYDGEYLYFRKILNGDPVKYKKGEPIELLPYGWNVLIEVTGDNYADYSVSIDGTGSADHLHTMYNLDNDNKMDGETGFSITATETPYSSGEYIYLLNSEVRVKQITADNSFWIDGDPDYFLETRVPISWLSRQGFNNPPPVNENTVIRFAAGSGASGQTINKDLVGQTSGTNIEQVLQNSASLTLGSSYGILTDSRHNISKDNYGLWYYGETVYLTGQSWPGSSSSYYTGSLNIKIEDSSGNIVWSGLVPVESDGTVNDQASWLLEGDINPGIYDIFVKNPIHTGEYNLKDTFTIMMPNLENSSKNVSTNIALPGEILDYTINVNNVGNYLADNILVTDNFPLHTEYVANSTYLNGILVSDVDGSSVLNNGLDIGSLEPGDNSQISFSLKVSPETVGQQDISNIAIINYDVSSQERIQISREAYTLVNSPQINITKESDVTDAQPQDIVQYQTTIENVGSSDANNVAVVDYIPSDTTYQLNTVIPDSTSTGVTVYYKHELNGNFDQNEELPIIAIKWIFDSIEVGAVESVTFKVKVK